MLIIFKFKRKIYIYLGNNNENNYIIFKSEEFEII